MLRFVVCAVPPSLDRELASRTGQTPLRPPPRAVPGGGTCRPERVMAPSGRPVVRRGNAREAARAMDALGVDEAYLYEVLADGRCAIAPIARV